MLQMQMSFSVRQCIADLGTRFYVVSAHRSSGTAHLLFLNKTDAQISGINLILGAVL